MSISNHTFSSSFIHNNHLQIFESAAKLFNCHILVRKTGFQSINWIGKPGYTGKRGDMKANTAKRDVGGYQIAGLVCSPVIHPQAFSTPKILQKAYKFWAQTEHLITTPPHGFSNNQAVGVRTPYVLQTNTRHQHYGCVALVEMGLLTPRYIHGDYDLYAIIPAGKPFNPHVIDGLKKLSLGSTMFPEGMSEEERSQLAVKNIEGELSFSVATYINISIEKTSQDLLGALMVNHGEQVNLGGDAIDHQEVLVILPEEREGKRMYILKNQAEHEEFYKNA